MPSDVQAGSMRAVGGFLPSQRSLLQTGVGPYMRRDLTRDRSGVSANHVHGFGRFNVQNLSSLPGLWRVEYPRHILERRRLP